MNLKILIVEDDDDAREALHELLSAQGFETMVAENGTEAIAIAAHFRPHVLLCDWQLPGRCDGADVAREVQENLDIPVIFFTGAPMTELRTKTADLRVLAYLPKPLDVDRLTAALSSV
jgi:DNA-binding response OmpR family regulator